MKSFIDHLNIHLPQRVFAAVYKCVLSELSIEKLHCMHENAIWGKSAHQPI